MAQPAAPTRGDARFTLLRAQTFLARLGGLLALPRLQDDEALYLAPCASVHTCFMRYAIDVAFVDRQGRVLKLVDRLPPWRAASCWGAHGAVEFPAGAAARHGLQAGQVIPVGPQPEPRP